MPQRFDVPGCDDLPVFAVTDFAVAQEAGRLVPRLIELQAFPTLHAFQVAQCEELSYVCPDGHRLDWYLSGLDTPAYQRVVGEAILSGLAPEEVILLDLDPPHQKTAIDFAFTEKFWGVRALDPSQIEKRGRELWYDRDGKRTRIRRIYNRLIFDELEATAARLPFDLTSRLDVSWAGHPNWYFRWSKHCLPEISHATVPESRLLSDFSAPPEDLDNWVLKPLFPLRARASRSKSRPGSGSHSRDDARPLDPHAQDRVRARPRDGRRQLLQGRGARDVRMARRRSLSRSSRSRASRRAR